MDALVPRMMLPTIAERVVRGGKNGHDGLIRVTVRAARQDERLRLELTVTAVDGGRGQWREHEIGLDGTREQLQRLYGRSPLIRALQYERACGGDDYSFRQALAGEPRTDKPSTSTTGTHPSLTQFFPDRNLRAGDLGHDVPESRCTSRRCAPHRLIIDIADCGASAAASRGAAADADSRSARHPAHSCFKPLARTATAREGLDVGGRTAPPLSTLNVLPPERIYQAITTGRWPSMPCRCQTSRNAT